MSGQDRIDAAMLIRQRDKRLVLGRQQRSGQELSDPVDRVLGDVFEHVAQIRVRIEAVEFGCADQAVEHTGAFPTARSARSAALLSISMRPSSR